MNANNAIKVALDTADMIAMAYLDDLTDEEMMVRPAARCNHINWQLGHLIVSEHGMLTACTHQDRPALPEGLAEKYSTETADCDDPSALATKAELLEAYRAQRDATCAVLATLTADDLDKPTGEAIREYAPTVGAAILMQETHWMMHAGQWAVIRRMLGRDPLF